MARINLLPWRESLRKKRQRDFGVSIVIALLAVAAAAAGTHYFIEDMIQYQNKRNSLLNKEISAMDRKIKSIQALEKTKAKLLARMDVIQQLQGSRPQVVHLFDEIVTTIPDGTHLNKLTQKGSDVTLNGEAQSNARVSSYMRNIESSKWLDKPNLQVITNKNERNDGLSTFTLIAKQVSPAKETENSGKIENRQGSKGKGKK
ncbi:MAG: PilN domain-containing protein [Chromatiaceae bacterium]|nr:PilN domain-containing protein [Chromatiaceae bacterium]MCP5444661.1 PilN domain-containing protein [Chromatiaceae bacterium]